eukprot:m.231730 g.231730  ORF g.231730 m.231730 type:complete len:218 (+) comp17369_c0_seq6:149-802(+)
MASDRTDGRVLSLAVSRDGKHLAAGDDVGCVRVMEVRLMRTQQRLVLGHGQGSRSPVLVWASTFISDTLLATGDSEGRVQLWSTAVGVLLQTLQTHEADILALSLDGNSASLYATGIDHKVVRLQEVKPSEGKQAAGRWAVTTEHRYHTHDIRCMEVTNDAVYTGGIDAQITRASPTLTKIIKASFYDRVWDRSTCCQGPASHCLRVAVEHHCSICP